jgi:hypothetical protein
MQPALVLALLRVKVSRKGFERPGFNRSANRSHMLLVVVQVMQRVEL